MLRLSSSTLQHLPSSIAKPGYDRNRVRAGILHMGTGAFHRAHQAVYTDDAMRLSGGDWGIIGASLRNPHAAAQLNPQNGLYTVCAQSAQGQEQRLIGALQRVLVAREEPDTLDAVIADPAIRVITLTITEKGYCLGDDGWSLDTESPAVRSDLNEPALASTAIGVLARGLVQRAANSGAPLTIISCDNLTENSRRLRCSLTQYLQHSSPETVQWIEQRVRFPCSMVDRIVPAVSEQVLSRQATELGLRDEAAVFTEPFCQWVIEDDFAGPIPDWQRAGALLVPDIAPFESAKLRLLNASHSAIAYTGLLAGLETVADVMRDAQLGAYIRRLVTTELIPSITPPPGLDLETYGEQLLQRFANPCLHHRCAQIAMDGSEKIPLRWQQTLNTLPADSLLTKSLACWCFFILATALPIEDPRVSELTAQRNSANRVKDRISNLLQRLRLGGGDTADDVLRLQSLITRYQEISDIGVRVMLDR